MQYHCRLRIENITTENKVQCELVCMVEATITAVLEFLNPKTGDCELKYRLNSCSFSESENKAVYKALNCLITAKLTIEDVKEYNLKGLKKPNTIHSIECEITDEYRRYFYDNFKKDEWVQKMKFIF